MTTATRYYAVPDPGNPARLTYWRFDGRKLRPWPSTARYGPVLHPDDVPQELLGAERATWIHRWYRQNAAEWRLAVGAELRRDPYGCLARFAVHTNRCGHCAEPLSDDAGKLCSVGPECRGGMPVAALTAMIRRTMSMRSESRAMLGPVTTNPPRPQQCGRGPDG